MLDFKLVGDYLLSGEKLFTIMDLKPPELSLCSDNQTKFLYAQLANWLGNLKSPIQIILNSNQLVMEDIAKHFEFITRLKLKHAATRSDYKLTKLNDYSNDLITLARESKLMCQKYYLVLEREFIKEETLILEQEKLAFEAESSKKFFEELNFKVQIMKTNELKKFLAEYLVC